MLSTLSCCRHFTTVKVLQYLCLATIIAILCNILHNSYTYIQLFVNYCHTFVLTTLMEILSNNTQNIYNGYSIVDKLLQYFVFNNSYCNPLYYFTNFFISINTKYFLLSTCLDAAYLQRLQYCNNFGLAQIIAILCHSM